ncbi:MAG: polysaccharide deacetylase family protein [Clostridiaceae bacterium]|nr:polysaccharide deacetylase family protein [Clostridiaceae bacterium]
MARYLMVNADDCGMCHAANAAMSTLLQCGGITSATIMFPCSWANEAVTIAKTHPDKSIGVHLTTTAEWTDYRWGSLTGAACFRDAEGYFYRSAADAERHADAASVDAEFRAQIERAKACGLTPSHMDSHMGTAYGVASGKLELLEMSIKLAAEYGLSFRFPTKHGAEEIAAYAQRFGMPADEVRRYFDGVADCARNLHVAMPDYLIAHGHLKQARDYDEFRTGLMTHIGSFPEGVTEVYIHPSEDSPELRAITPWYLPRVWEYQFFADAANLGAIREMGIEFLPYRALPAVLGL